MLQPELTFESIELAGRSAYHYEFSYDDNLDYYVIPITRTHYLNLLFNSADNSVAKGGWDELAQRAKTGFLQSLTMSGDVPTCD